MPDYGVVCFGGRKLAQHRMMDCLGLQKVLQWYNDYRRFSGASAMMTKKLSKHGNSLALVIDRSILELLEIDEQTPLEITTDGRALVIVPAPDENRRKRFEQALSDCNERFGPVLRRLAE